jgi:SET domain-containing protein
MFKTLSEREMQVVATRDIVAGEELFIDYGREYWKQRL